MRTLIVLRHAKAAQVPGLADRERPLTDRGERDAKRVGEEISAMGLEPDVVLCSPAVRTRRTAELAFPEVEISYERDIYEAYPEELLELVRRTDPGLGTVVLCGHNPGVHELALSLAGGDYVFRPGAFAVVGVESSWEELWPGQGRLVTRWDPKEP
ncbi:SixA phosphatase family protein [Nonomuraea gerenzanensis]|uniref:Phosphohistidine phosphatase SixA n=1 Tax=Nonomuraea gerenzanensis TaxID=93944 RepID=A0A1M4DY93_9ACTN|nr:histidine phosphatase family protein [Nonomuraea gerenzanensis]UBU13817.1 histidine phosphatase family protein [Nonomuraea gerenzanensis]SBO91492.1 Phosphohistidine phosphatase SixA [Nonomuraea gerenzanensis]